MPEEKKNQAENNLIKDSGLDMSKIVIHTIPKRYLTKSHSAGSGNHRLSGLLILIAGILVLAGVFAGAYYFLLKKPMPILETEISDNSTADELTPEASPKTPEPMPLAPEKEIEPLQPEAASSTGSRKREIAVEPAVEPEDTEPIEPESSDDTPRIEAAQPVYKPSFDTDQDGLTDMEEILLDASPSAADSDGDGYRDAEELLKLYNPAGGGDLGANPNIKQYANPGSGYRLYYPAAWAPSSVSSNESVVFRIDSRQFMQVISIEVPPATRLEDWYMEKFDVSYVRSEQISSKKGWIALKTDDQLTYYLHKPGTGNVFALSYNPGESGILHYPRILELMAQSLELPQ